MVLLGLDGAVGFVPSDQGYICRHCGGTAICLLKLAGDGPWLLHSCDKPAVEWQKICCARSIKVFDGFWGVSKSENGIGCFPLTNT